MKISDKTAYSLFLKTHDLTGNRELFLSKETQRKIFFSVLLGHLIFFLSPFVISYLQKFLIHKKKQPMLTVKLFEDPKPPQPEAPVEKAKPEPPRQEQKKPEQPKKEIKKPEPKVEPPKPEPKKPEPPKEVKKTEPKHEKPVVKVPSERPKPKWTPVNPNEIKKSKEVVKIDKPIPPSVDSSKLKEKILKIQDQIKTNQTISPPSGPQPIDYYDKVSAYLYELWIQPSKMELRGNRPKVIISLSVDSSGKLTSSSIKSKSGVPSMDASVEELLKKLSVLPVPPSGGMSFDVSLEISE